MEELRIKYENSLLQSQLEIQEQTFQHISREIHDNIGQKLSLAKLNLNTLDTELDPSQKIDHAVSLIGESITSLTSLSRSLSSDILLTSGLIKGLEHELNNLQKVGLFALELKVTGDPVFLDSEKELLIFRITQEALHNIIKHADAFRISIHLHFTETIVMLEIKDDGKGFLLSDNKSDGLGLKNIKKRADILKAHFAISSQPGSGTCITINIPFL